MPAVIMKTLTALALAWAGLVGAVTVFKIFLSCAFHNSHL